MYLVAPTYLFTPKGFLTHHAFVFNQTIIWMGKIDELPSKYQELPSLELPEFTCITPGLINSHVHLEFSANKTSLKYGRFLPWLYSVIENRDEIIGKCTADCIDREIDTMIQTGTTAFGAISSYGTEMQACVDTPAKVVFFNELIGSSPAMADALWGDFISRVDDSKHFTSNSFQPAVAIHSPYAVHPILVKKAISMAVSEKLPLTAHLLESYAEREWLTSNEGDFKPFFKELLKQEHAATGIEEFISSFDQQATLFTHATHISDNEIKLLQDKGHAIIHCPISNRLLGNGCLNLEKLYEASIDYVCGTDGLSSNYSLDLFEELRAALYMHDNADLDTLALSLLHSVTTLAGEHLGLNCGKIQEGFDADFLIFDLEKELDFEEDLALHLILKNFDLQSIYINGTDHKDNHAAD